MVQLNVLNGRTIRQRKAINCGCGCDSCNEGHPINGFFQDLGESFSNAYHSVGDWVNKAWNTSLNLDELFSDMYNFHLETFDGVQRQWTGVDLIKTNFTADWIKGVSDNLTMYSHIGGAIVITYILGPAVMPILQGVGIMIGSAIRTQDTRYIEYIKSMQNYPTKRLTREQDQELIGIIVWAFVNIKLHQPTGEEVGKYLYLLKTSPDWDVKRMFFEFKQYVLTQKLYMDINVISFNVSLVDTLLLVLKLRRDMLCDHEYGIVSGQYFTYEYMAKASYLVLVGDMTMSDIYNMALKIRTAPYNIAQIENCYRQNLGYVPKIIADPFAGYINETGTTIADIMANDPSIDDLPLIIPGDTSASGDSTENNNSTGIDSTGNIFDDSAQVGGSNSESAGFGTIGILLLLGIGGSIVASSSSKTKSKRKK